MPFDPALPRTGTRATSAEMRSQLTSLKALIDAIPAGPPGPQGAVGPAGPAGQNGQDGGPGPQGDQGPQGPEGRYVSGVEDNGSGQAIIQMSDGNTYGPFTVASGPQGQQGEQGPQGSDGPQGNQGEQGSQGPEGRYVSGVEDSGMGQAIIRMSDGSTYGPFTVASGPAGDQGPQGEQGPQGDVSASDMENAINNALGGTSNNSNSVAQLEMTVSDPPTQSEMQTIANKLDELIAALRR